MSPSGCISEVVPPGRRPAGLLRTAGFALLLGAIGAMTLPLVRELGPRSAATPPHRRVPGVERPAPIPPSRELRDRRRTITPPRGGRPQTPEAPIALGAEIARRIDTEVGSLGTPVAVDGYLAELEQRARAQGAVTALEVEPGMRALEQLAVHLSPDELQARRVAFTQRMGDLSRELTDEPQVH